MSTGNEDGSVPPFVDEKAEAKRKLDRRGLLNTAFMFVAWALLTIAMLGGAKVLFDYLGEQDSANQATSVQLQATPTPFTPLPENYTTEKSPAPHTPAQSKNELRLAQVVSLILVFVTGWCATLISIRKLHNIFLPGLVRLYSFGAVAGILVVYGRAVLYLWKEWGFSGFKYSVVILAGYLVLVSLYLLSNDSDRLPYQALLGLAAVGHIFVIVFHYVFSTAPNPDFILKDLYFFILIGALLALLVNNRLYERLQQLLPQNE